MSEPAPGGKANRVESWLEDMRINAEAIERYTSGITQQNFIDDEMRQDAVVRRIEIIGEAADRIIKAIPDYESAVPNLPLRIAKRYPEFAHSRISTRLPKADLADGDARHSKFA